MLNLPVSDVLAQIAGPQRTPQGHRLTPLMTAGLLFSPQSQYDHIIQHGRTLQHAPGTPMQPPPPP